LKRNSHDDDLRLVHVKELRSRIDKSLASLDSSEGTDGEKCMQGMLNNLGQGKKRKVHASKEGRLQT
jgi:hypothetical protein